MKTYTTKAQMEQAKRVLWRAARRIAKILDRRDLYTNDPLTRATRHAQIRHVLMTDMGLAMAIACTKIVGEQERLERRKPAKAKNPARRAKESADE